MRLGRLAVACATSTLFNSSNMRLISSAHCTYMDQLVGDWRCHHDASVVCVCVCNASPPSVALAISLIRDPVSVVLCVCNASPLSVALAISLIRDPVSVVLCVCNASPLSVALAISLIRDPVSST